MMNQNLLDKLEQARQKYKPEIIELLLIAEAAPESLDHFFYYENVKSADYLFLGVIEVLNPELKNAYLQTGRNSEAKEIILEELKAIGIYLIELYQLPLPLSAETETDAIATTKAKVVKLVNHETPIIAINANVYDALKHELSDYKLIPERIPFPSSGQQENFKVSFESALRKSGLLDK